MSGVVVVLWLGTAAARPNADPELDSWARARLVRIEDASSAPAVAAEYDDALVRRIEELLEQARVAADAMDEPTATARLADASGFIEKHPELPQAAWLSAERMVLEAALYDRRADSQVSGRRPSAELPDAEKALALRRAASALEGRRIAPLAETAKPVAPDATADAKVRVAIEGLQAGDQLYWDGRLAQRTVIARQQSHHARVVRQGRTVWAGWTSVPERAGVLRLAAPTPQACSLDDLGSTLIREQQVYPAAGARCRSWAVARPRAGGGIEIASCTGNRCGPLLTWRRGDGGDFTGPPQPAPERHAPAWLFVAAGIGAAALTGVVLWQSGVFDEADPARDRVIFTGPARR